MALILDGRSVAAAIKQALEKEVAALDSAPVLAVVQVGDDPAAGWYVRSIKRAAEGVGMRFAHTQLAADVGQAQIVESIRGLNTNREVSGIIVQMPLPRGIDANVVLATVDPRKDVDGLHPLNAGRLAQGLPAMVPNTPAGGIALLKHYNLPVAGKHAAIVGRSNVVGKPLALLLLQADATVTICHSRTPDLGATLRRADIVAVATGKPGLVSGAMLKPGATVIDFGINDQDGKIVGDVDWASAEPVAGAITPVPGGTGPVTNMMLLRNTLAAHQSLAEAQGR